jgi:hypothetical protein
MAKLTDEFKKGMRGLTGDTVAAGLGISLRDFIFGIGKKAKDLTEKQIDKMIETSPRVNLLYVLLALKNSNPEAAKALWQRRRQAKAEGKENELVALLGEAIPKKDGFLDEEKARVIFTQLGEMNEEEFKDAWDELNNDPIAEKIRYYLGQGKNFAEATALAIAHFSGIVILELDELDAQAEQKAEEMKRKPFGRIANWLFK